jgi:DNA-binding NarL/FixJ family response regulator
MNLTDSEIATLTAGKRGPRPAPGELSKRERQVLELMGEGLSNKQISAKIFVSHKTVSVFRGRIAEKLGLWNDGDRNVTSVRIVSEAIARGLLTDGRSSDERLVSTLTVRELKDLLSSYCCCRSQREG